MRLLKAAFHNLMGLVFPARCVVCERSIDPSSRSPLCVRHARDLVRTEPPTCSKCGRKMFGESVEEFVCNNCRSHPIHYDAGYSAYLYDDVIRELIHLFKYRKKRYVRAFLGNLLLDYAVGRVDRSYCDAIIPVPLHWRRRWVRGFNQAVDLAKPLSRHFGIPIMNRGLRRARYTPSQASLPRAERRDNIKNAFKLRRRAKVAGKKLLLVDDLITTGATLNECARVLKGAGALNVIILTLAHPSDVMLKESEIRFRPLSQA